MSYDFAPVAKAQSGKGPRTKRQRRLERERLLPPPIIVRRPKDEDE